MRESVTVVIFPSHVSQNMWYLVATDGSEISDRAIEHAAVEACARDANLRIVHVLTPEIKLVDGAIVLPGEREAIEHSQRMLERAARLATSTAAEHGTEIEISTELLTGRPADAITEYAKERNVDVIFVGHRGRADSDVDRGSGSVAKSVVDKASVPVTVVR